jgi:phosphate transport system permease protein
LSDEAGGEHGVTAGEQVNAEAMAQISPTVSPPTGFVRKPSSPIERALRHGDIPFNAIIIACGILTVLLIVGFGLLLFANSRPVFAQQGLGFVISDVWNPPADIFGALPFIVGTFSTSLIAVLIAVPLGVAIAIFLTELCPMQFRRPIGTLVEMLAAIPSVVYGLWGIQAFIPGFIGPIGTFITDTLGTSIPLFAGPFFGVSIFAAGVILAIMILPTITAITRDVFLAVPSAQREASFGLGSTRWEMISQVLIPYGLSGILGGVILGLGRALGETMAVTMTIGNVSLMPTSIMQTGYSLASVIANEWGEAGSDGYYTSALLAMGLLLFLLSLLVNIMARLLVWAVSRRNPEQRS